MANPTSDTSNRLNGSAPDVKSRMMGVEHQLEKTAKNAGEEIGAMASDFASRSADSLKSGREYVKENPVRGVAIAAAAGAVAGSLLTMAMRKRGD